MQILVIGLGVIGSTYGYLFQKAGHQVEHYIREGSSKRLLKELEVDLLDGRSDPRGCVRQDRYSVRQISRKSYDFIFVSLPLGEIETVLTYLDQQNIRGSIVLACGIWKDRDFLNKLMQGREYILGYPVAGGKLSHARLTACVFDHFMLEAEEKTEISNYQDLVELFATCQLKLEKPYDMLEWIWLHMGINAAVVAVAGCHADIHDPSTATENLMNSIDMLAEVLKSIRETSKIVERRGVNLRHYRQELLPYRLPICLAAPLMKYMFAKNRLSRKIMSLHSNLPDLLFVCHCLDDFGREYQVAAPHFYRSYEKFLEKVRLIQDVER